MSEPGGGIFHRLYNGETAFDFVGRRWRWLALSGIVILIGLASLLTRGLNQGIDFKGGTSWEMPARGVSVSQARDGLRGEGLGNAKIQTLRGQEGTRLRVQAELGGEGDAKQAKITAIAARLAKLGRINSSEVSVNDVGPSWGKDVSHKAQRALVFFFLFISLYITLRFEWKMAVAALAAVVHDILITVGIYSLSGFEVTPATVVAFLTILGYSIYDTIVVFDKVEENTRGLAATGRLSYADTVNLSMNQVLMRSLNTSLVAIMPILSVLLIGAYALGATALEDFGLALLIGLLTGAYSSIFVAAPLLSMLKEREPRYAAIRQRLASRSGGVAGAPLTPAAAAAMAGGGAGGAAPRPAPGDGGTAPLRPTASVGARSAASAAARPVAKRPPPRGRKKKRR